MVSTPQSEEIRIEIDLRKTRAEAERAGELSVHGSRASEISRDIRSLLATNADVLNALVTADPMIGTEPPKKADPQFIDAITILAGSIATLGVRDFIKLILQIVEVCRVKIPTTYEIEFPGGEKYKVSGPNVQPSDLQKLQRAAEQLEKPVPPTLHTVSSRILRIEALPRDR